MGFDPNAGNGKSAKFENVGDKVEGVVLSARDDDHVKNVDTGAPEYWDDAKTQPKYQWLIVLQCAPDGPDDDGVRKVYAKGGNFTAASGSGQSMQRAIGDAVKASGAKLLDEGGTLVVQHTGLGEKKKAAFSAPKLYKARYTPPAKGIAIDEDLI